MEVVAGLLVGLTGNDLKSLDCDSLGCGCGRVSRVGGLSLGVLLPGLLRSGWKGWVFGRGIECTVCGGVGGVRGLMSWNKI